MRGCIPRMGNASSHHQNPSSTTVILQAQEHISWCHFTDIVFYWSLARAGREILSTFLPSCISFTSRTPGQEHHVNVCPPQYRTSNKHDSNTLKNPRALGSYLAFSLLMRYPYPCTCLYPSCFPRHPPGCATTSINVQVAPFIWPDATHGIYL